MAVIYSHTKLGEIVPFYIGIGNSKRPYSTADRSAFWKKTVDKYGYEIRIIQSDLSWEDAQELEMLLISIYGRRNLGTGCLVNMTDGGDGTLGCVYTEERRQKLIKSLTGRELSPSHKKSLSKAKKGTISNYAQRIINKETTEIFPSIKLAAESMGIKPSTLRAKLRGQNPNNTKMEYFGSK